MAMKIKSTAVVFAFLIALSLAACSSHSSQKKQKVVWHKGKIIVAGHVDRTQNDPTDISLRGGSILPRNQHVTLDSNGNFKFERNAYTQEKLSLGYSNGWAVFMAGPSDSIFIRIKASDFEKEEYPDYEISGPAAKFSETMQQYMKIGSPFLDDVFTEGTVKAKLPVKDFLAFLQRKINQGDSIIRVFGRKNHPPKQFFTWAKNENLYAIANLLVEYNFYRHMHHIPYKYEPELYDTKMFPVDNDRAVTSQMYTVHLNQYVLYRYVSGDSIVRKLYREKKKTEAYARALQNVLKNEKPGLSRNIMYFELLKNEEQHNPETFIALMNRKDIYKGNRELFEILEKLKHQWENQDYARVNFTKIEQELTGDFYANLLKKYAGKVIFIDFWEAYCVPCRAEFDYTQKLHNEFKGKPVAFVNVCMNSLPEQCKKTIKDLKITGDNYYLNTKQSRIISDKLSIHAFPTFFIIDKNGKLVNTHAPYPSSGKQLTKLLDKYVKM